jgi:hypothetical protein
MGRRLRMPAPKRLGASPHSYAALNAASLAMDVLDLDDIALSTRGRTHEPMAEHRLACPSALGTLVQPSSAIQPLVHRRYPLGTVVG